LLKPILFIKALEVLSLNNRGLGLPNCGLGVTVPSSKKPKPNEERQSI